MLWGDRSALLGPIRIIEVGSPANRFNFVTEEIRRNKLNGSPVTYELRGSNNIKYIGRLATRMHIFSAINLNLPFR